MKLEFGHPPIPHKAIKNISQMINVKTETILLNSNDHFLDKNKLIETTVHVNANNSDMKLGINNKAEPAPVTTSATIIRPYKA